ncbi:MAG TPA: Ppx/GppA phosphatase family protein [Mariprofundaceae bacterium]|nr:Ppx/GppA phosphatase family protein [Mariprofundaceae bacterium]
MPFAAIDIGSNTFRLLIAEPAPENSLTPWKIIHYTHRIVRLGEGLHHHGRLSDAGMTRAMQAFDEFSDFLAMYRVPANRTLALATAAMREAKNGMAFRHRVADETGIHIHIIEGEKEAAMSLAGSCAVLPENTRADMLLFDIGGGSTEFIRARHALSRDAISRKLGVVRLIEAHLNSDPPSAADYQAMKDATLDHLREVAQGWQDKLPPRHLVGTAGTVTTLAATELDLYPYDADIINNHVIQKASFLALRDRLLSMSHAERQAIRTIEQGRSDLIIAGLAIVEAVMDFWDYKEMIVVDAGLLEGAWLEISQSK